MPNSSQNIISSHEGESPNRGLIAQIAIKQRERANVEAQKLLNLKAEYDLLHPSIIQMMEAENAYTAVAKKYLDVLYSRCFLGATPIEAVTAYSTPDCPPRKNQANEWKKRGVNLFFEYLEKSSLQISSELRDFLWNKGGDQFRSKYKTLEEATSPVDPIAHKSQQIRDTIRDVLQHSDLNVEYAPADVDMLIGKIENAKLEPDSVNNLTAYTRKVVYHWMFGQVRSTESRSRAQEYRKEKIEKEKEQQVLDQENEVKFSQARDEYNALRSQLRSAPNSIPTVLKQLDILYYSIFEKETDEQLQLRYPESKRATRDVWRKRARDFIWPRCSDNLKTALSKFTSKKRS